MTRAALVVLWGAALGGGVLAAGALAEVTGDREIGRKLAGQCGTCHGLDGYARQPNAPHIGGESESYIRAQLTAFRDGSRQHEIMSIVASALSDEQIADLAAWYAGHDVTVDLEADPATAPADCVACHGADGLHRFDDVPNIAGEPKGYIDAQLEAFRSGRRVHEFMTPIASELTEEELKAAADWYAAVQITIELVE